MFIQVNLGNRKRKELAGVVGGIIGATPNYKGPPSYDYDVRLVVIGRDATITFKDEHKLDVQMLRLLMAGLEEHGFAPELTGATEYPDDELDDDELPFPEVARHEEAETPGPPVIRVPLDGFDAASLENIRLLVDSKAALIKKSLDVEHLPIEESETTLDFPWFDTEPPPAELTAYINLINAMCNMAKRQKRVLATEKPTDNEKFVFRLFLVRLGLIGDEYAETRRILLRNLPGNGSWKSADGKSTRTARDDMGSGFSDFMEAVDPEAALQKISFIKRLGYFLLHFDE